MDAVAAIADHMSDVPSLWEARIISDAEQAKELADALMAFLKSVESAENVADEVWI